MNKNTLRAIQIFYWLAVIAYLIFFVVHMVPRKGFSLSDLGIYFTSGNSYLFGVFNEYGLAGFFNAILIKLHFNYVNLSRAYFTILFLSGVLFFISLRLRASFYWLAPIAALLMTAATPLPVLAYESSGPVMLIIASALLFIPYNYNLSRLSSALLYFLAAFFFVYSSVTNLILVPSIFINAIILFFIFPKIKSKTFIFSYIVFSVVGLYLIIYKVFPLFELTSYMNPNYFSWATKRAIEYSCYIIGFILAGFAITKVMYWIIKAFFTKFNLVNKYEPKLTTFVIFSLVLWLVARVLLKNPNFFLWSNNLVIYALAFLGALFAINGKAFFKHKTSFILLIALLLQIEYFIAMSAAVPINFTIRSTGSSSEILLIVLLWVEFYFSQVSNENLAKTLISLFIVISAFMFPLKLQRHFAFGQSVSLNKQEVTTIPRLDGLYVPANYLKQIRKIVDTYHKNQCENKLFIVRNRFPMFYYIFNRPAHAPFFYLNSVADLQQLKASQKANGFCYIGDFLFQRYHDSHFQGKNYVKLYNWLNENSKKIIRIDIPSFYAKNIFVKIYVG